VSPNESISDGIIETKLNIVNKVGYVGGEISVESLSSGAVDGKDILYR
jgi:hypothetical protein